MDYYGRRNDILFAIHDIPWPYVLLHLAAVAIKGVAYAVTRAHNPWLMLKGIWDGYRLGLKAWETRTPVDVRTYRLSRILKKKGPKLLTEINPMLSNPQI